MPRPPMAPWLLIESLLTRAQLHNLQRPIERCVLCGAEHAYVGVFVPDDPQAYGAPAGLRRLVAYGLCVPCHQRPRTDAERALAQTLTHTTRTTAVVDGDDTTIHRLRTALALLLGEDDSARSRTT